MKKISLFFFISTILLIVSFNIFSQNLRLEKIWETDTIFKRPESIVFDSLRNRLYISNYNRYPKKIELCNDYISILDLDGNIISLRWIKNLKAPTGLYIKSDCLYIVERDGISKYDIDSKKFIWKKIIPNAIFLNDIIVDNNESIYITDTSPKIPKNSIIRKLQNNKIDTLVDEPIMRANGLQKCDNYLIIGNNGDNYLKKINLENLEISNIAKLDTGIIDGIKVYQKNTYLVSHCEGRLFLISSDNEVIELLDLRNQKINIADFEYIHKSNLIIIPTYESNKIIAYKITRN